MKEICKKNVCYICYRRFPDTNFEHYSRFVSQNGYDVTVIAYKDAGQKEFEILDGRKVYRIALPDTPAKKQSRIRFDRVVVNFLRRNNFSLVHIHHTCPFFLVYKLFGRKSSKYLYHCTSYPISKSRFRVYKEMVINFLQAVFMDRVLIQSVELKERLLGIRRLRRTEIIPIGYNGTLFYPVDECEKRNLRKKLGISSTNQILIYLGSMSPVRELDRLIIAFAQISIINANARLFMVGDGKGLDKLIALASSLNISQSVIFPGRIPHEKLSLYICASDIAISYVPINENYNYNPPLKSFEFLACGLPMIATKTMSNTRIVRDGENGILVEDSVNALRDSIINLLSDHAKRAHLSNNAPYSVSGFDFKEITKKQLIPIYDYLLQ